MRLTSRPAQAGRPQKVVRQLLRERNALLRKVSQLNELAFRDPLTELRNRRCFDQRLDEELSRATRYPDEVFSVLFIDINGFKQINDNHGHQVGDETLKHVARLLQRTLRTHDVCCRIGGDEFAVLMPHTDARAGIQVMQRLRAEIEVANARLRHQKDSGKQGPAPVGLSMGRATWSRGIGVDALLRVADAAMYTNKRQKTMRLVSGPRTRPVASQQSGSKEIALSLVGNCDRRSA